LALKAIRLEALRDTPDAYGSSLDAALTFSEDRWRAMTAQQGYFLVERDGEVVGMAAGGFNDHRPGEHWLYAMYVTPSARGGVVATRLVDAVVAWARSEGASALYLDVTTSLARARAFYQKTGFQLTGERRVMDRDHSIELVRMRRELVSA
jgi:GNAT superfamily N-acetyltransferase